MDLGNSVLIHMRYCVGVGHTIKSIETKLNSSGARVLIKTTWLGLNPVRSVSTGFATCSQRPSPGSIRSFGSPALTRAHCRSPDFSLGLNPSLGPGAAHQHLDLNLDQTPVIVSPSSNDLSPYGFILSHSLSPYCFPCLLFSHFIR